MTDKRVTNPLCECQPNYKDKGKYKEPTIAVKTSPIMKVGTCPAINSGNRFPCRHFKTMNIVRLMMSANHNDV